MIAHHQPGSRERLQSSDLTAVPYQPGCDRTICRAEPLLGICQVDMLLIDWRKDWEEMNVAVTLECWVNSGVPYGDFLELCLFL